MKLGKVHESIFDRAILKQIKKCRNDILIRPAIGEDNGAIRLSDEKAMVYSTNPVTGTLKELGVLGIYSVVNNLVTSGAEPVGVIVTILLPYGGEEKVLRTIVKDMEMACQHLNMEILGGHTQWIHAVNEPVLTLTGIGVAAEEKLLRTSNMKPNQELVLTKSIGICGTSILSTYKETELRTRYSKEFIDGAKSMIDQISIVKEAQVGIACGAAMLHDLSYGGVFGALWEAAAASKVGLEIYQNRIPIKQETVEVCEFYDLNPFQLMSSGSLLIAADRGSDIVEELLKAGIEAVVIGRATEGKDRIIIHDDERRFLEPPKIDELLKVEYN